MHFGFAGKILDVNLSPKRIIGEKLDVRSWTHCRSPRSGKPDNHRHRAVNRHRCPNIGENRNIDKIPPNGWHWKGQFRGVVGRQAEACGV
jgi:hypothetical protein